LWRIGVGAGYGRDVAQPKQPATGNEVDAFQVVLRLEDAADANKDLFVGGLHSARWGDGVLFLERTNERQTVNAETRELSHRKLDIDTFILRANDVDLGDVRHLQQARTCGFRAVPQLAVGKAVGGEGVHNAVGIAELVVEKRSDEPLREVAADIAHLLAYLIPDVADYARGRALLQ